MRVVRDASSPLGPRIVPYGGAKVDDGGVRVSARVEYVGGRVPFSSVVGRRCISRRKRADNNYYEVFAHNCDLLGNFFTVLEIK